MAKHPVALAHEAAIAAAGMYELIGFRAWLAECVVSAARDVTAPGGLERVTVAVMRLDAVEEELRRRYPAITIDRKGEVCLGSSTPTK